MNFSISLLFVSLFLAAGVSIAQVNPDTEGSSEKGRTIRFYCLTEGMPQYFYKESKSKEVQIGDASGSLSLPHPMPTDRVLEIYKKIPPPPEAPVGTKPLLLILATTEIPAGFSKAIVLLLPGGDREKETLRAVAYGDSYRLHPEGMVRVFNLSPYEIKLKVASAESSFKSGGSGVMPWNGGKSNVVVFQTWVKKDDQWMVVAINELATRPNLRAFMFASKGITDIASRVCFDAVQE